VRTRASVGRWVTAVLLGFAFVYACSLATSDDIPRLQLVAQALYFAVAAAGLNLLTGYNGQVSIGHGAFFGIGAFTSAILIKDHGWEYLPTLPVAAVLAAVVGVLVGFPALRVKGLYLALVTLGLATIFPDVIKRFFDESGQGQVTVRSRLLRAPEWWPAGIGDRYQWAYVLTLVLTVAAFVVAAIIVRLRFGRALVAVRDHEAAATTLGIDPARVKLGAFGLSAAYAGLAGSLSVLVLGNAEANKATTFNLSILFLIAVVVGGTATVLGPLVGGWFVVMLQDQVNAFAERPDRLLGLPVPGPVEDFVRGKTVLTPAIFGIVLVVSMYLLPDGIVGASRRGWNRAWAAAQRRRNSAPTPASDRSDPQRKDRT